MRTNFNKSFDLVIGSEGGFQNDPNDRGNWTSGKIGVGQNKGTKYGVSAMAYPSLDIKNLTIEQARTIYKKDYWDRCRCDELPLGIDYLVFDIAVNHGIKDGVTFLQKAVGANPDGVFGPRTMASVYSKKPQDVIEELCVVRAFDYIQLRTFGRYGKGWFRRLMHTITAADDMNDSATM